MIDLPPVHLKLIVSIIRQHAPDCEVWAFGSRVTGTAKKFSDLDLTLNNCKKTLTFSQLSELREAFSESDLPIKVDVVDYAAASDEFRSVINQHKVFIPLD